MNKKRIMEQILKIRDSGETNMLDWERVQNIAFNKGMFELVVFIQEDRKGYARIILLGKFEDES